MCITWWFDTDSAFRTEKSNWKRQKKNVWRQRRRRQWNGAKAKSKQNWDAKVTHHTNCASICKSIVIIESAIRKMCDDPEWRACDRGDKWQTDTNWEWKCVKCWDFSSILCRSLSHQQTTLAPTDATDHRTHCVVYCVLHNGCARWFSYWIRYFILITINLICPLHKIRLTTMAYAHIH